MPAPRLFLVDSFNFIFRAFYARQRMNEAPMRTSRGTSTEAVYIFHNMIRRLLKDYQPEYFAAVFEGLGSTFRDALYPAYKATRNETPPELIEQIPLTERLLTAMNIPVLKLDGFEADDLMGTVARQLQGAELVIVSSDKDMLQLVENGRVRMLNPMKNDTLYDEASVEAFMGVPPARIIDLLALMGDSVDNIPGAPGIGEKGAITLVQQYGPVEEILRHAAEIPRKNYRESLLNHQEQILLSKQLATICQDAPFTVDLESLAIRTPDRAALSAMYRELEFYSFLKEVEPSAASAQQRTERRLDSADDVATWLGGSPQLALAAATTQPDLLGSAMFGLYTGGTEMAEAPVELLSTIRTPNLIVADWKQWLVCGGAVPEATAVEDILLYAFLVLADPSSCSVQALVSRYLERQPATVAESAAAIFDLGTKLRSDVLGGPLETVYREIDLPLVPVLARMERTGIRVDTSHLRSLASRMEGEIDSLANAIYALAGHPFNINSPAQLGKVLFEEMALPVQGKTGKTKNYSTAADVLEALAQEHTIAAKVLEYRQLTKLKGTYIDALPTLIRPHSGRLHTTFNPAGAATGRLSSSNPNLQNIPIRTEVGREIRAAFVPEPGWELIAADYSQIELRLLAHFSGDAVLVDSFRRGEDIHTRTAAEVFGVPPLMVTADLRRNAKAVNFGIVYGQTAFGLAAQLGIGRDEAGVYIRNYFERYSGVKKWIEGAIATVRKAGYTETLHGRRRPIPDIQSRNPNARGFAERTAVNTPLQGTAADLIKLAMIAIDRDLRQAGMRTRMLLQVHDELVLESPPDEVSEARALVKERMERIARLSVPLLVETGAGPNWRDAK